MNGPRFSIVAAAYNVAPYLREWFDSLLGQSYGAERLQVIVVDDGSDDATAALLASMSQEFPGEFTVTRQENLGQAAARNLGLSLATGRWLTFIDPDDFVAADYFTRVDRFLRRNPDAPMLATHLKLYLEAQNRHEPHALDHLFRTRDRLRNLEDDSRYFHASASAAFFRRDLVQQQGLQFSSRLGPHFEDAHFCVSYLLGLQQPVVGFLGSAHYSYRIRADRTSTSQRSMGNPRRFTDVPRYGYLDVLERARQLLGRVPRWLQQQMVYELRWYLKAESDPSVTTAAVDPAVAREFLELLQQVLAHLEAPVIVDFDAQPLEPVWRDILLHAFEDRWVSDELEQQQVGETTTWAYRFVGTRPVEDLLSTEVIGAKYRDVCLFGEVLIHERLIWAQTAPDLLVDGHVMTPGPDTTGVGRKVAVLGGNQAPPPDRYPRALGQHRRDVALSAARRLRSGVVRGRLALRHRGRGEVWLLDDGPGGLTRSSERFFEYLRARRPDLSVWFAADPEGPAWQRISQHSADRLVARGGAQWRDLLLHTHVLISSNPAARAQHPPEITKLREPAWLAVHLPGTSLAADMSRWLNPQQPDLILAASTDDAARIMPDGNNYRFGRPQVRVTGLPRYDRWNDAFSAEPVAVIDLSLPDGSIATSHTDNSWAPCLDEAERADYYAQWEEMLPELLQAAAGHEVMILSDETLPDLPTVRPRDVDLDEVLARCPVYVSVSSPLLGDARSRGSRVLVASSPSAPRTTLGCSPRDDRSIALMQLPQAFTATLDAAPTPPPPPVASHSEAALRVVESRLLGGPG